MTVTEDESGRSTGGADGDTCQTYTAAQLQHRPEETKGGLTMGEKGLCEPDATSAFGGTSLS